MMILILGGKREYYFINFNYYGSNIKEKDYPQT